MKVSEETKALLGTKIRASVSFDHYRWPRNGHQSGTFAIAAFKIDELLEGAIPIDLKDPFSGCYMFYAKGNMPKLDNKTKYIFTGKLTVDPKYGPQYNVIQVRLNYNLEDPDDQRKFFSYFMTGRQIENLFEVSSNPIALLDAHDLGGLMKVKGIGEATARRMCERYDECKDNSHAYVALSDMNLTKNAIDKLILRYGSADVVVDKIRENPYILIKEVRGYGWEKCDALALAQHLPRDSKERVLAYIQYYLTQEADQNGNSWVTTNTLISEAYEKCSPVTGDKLKQYIMDSVGGPLQLNNAIIGTLPEKDWPLLYVEAGDAQTYRIGLFKIRVMERKIALNLQRLRNARSDFQFDPIVCEQKIHEAELEQGFEYADEQKQAIYNILNNNVSIVTGSAGTGKSSMLNAVTKIFNYYGMTLEQCALSGRASSKMTEITKVAGKTIHRLLKYDVMTDQFRCNAENPIDADVVILDETSMVGGEIYLDLVQAVRSGSKFIMVGDIQQLEAIGMANILKDCMSAGGYIPYVKLTQIHRQAKRSGIITQSVLAASGFSLVKSDFQGTEIRGDLKDFKIICNDDPILVKDDLINEYRNLIFKQHIPVDQVQIIVPMRTRGELSCRVLNNELQAIVNPRRSVTDVPMTVTDSGMTYQFVFKAGDQIIITKNNYRAHRPGNKKDIVEIYNGNVGYIKSLTASSMIVNLTEQGPVELERDNWLDVNLAYAITCHKKQGDQIPYAIVGLDSSAYTMFSKEWIYTAMTRASKMCIFVTQAKVINTAVHISHVRIKQTWLKTDLLKLNSVEGGAK